MNYANVRRFRAVHWTFFTRFSMNEMTRYSLVFQASNATCSHHIEGHGNRWCYSSKHRGGQRYRSNPPENLGSYLAFHHIFPLNRYIWRFIIGVQNRYVSFSHCYIEVRMLRWYSRVWRPWSLPNPARAPSFLRESSPALRVLEIHSARISVDLVTVFVACLPPGWATAFVKSSKVCTLRWE